LSLLSLHKGEERREEERRVEERKGKERKGKERKGKKRKGREGKGKEEKERRRQERTEGEACEVNMLSRAEGPQGIKKENELINELTTLLFSPLSVSYFISYTK
jgi:hypothetical protein